MIALQSYAGIVLKTIYIYTYEHTCYLEDESEMLVTRLVVAQELVSSCLKIWSSFINLTLSRFHVFFFSLQLGESVVLRLYRVPS